VLNHLVLIWPDAQGCCNEMCSYQTSLRTVELFLNPVSLQFMM
jgi:hypothetical protein